MARIALTGGIASGKSMVSDDLARRGAVIIDSDVLAREVVEPGTEGLHRIVERFGSEVLNADGSLDRAKLGNLIFSDERSREDLNAIVHPLVRARARELESAAPPDALVVHVIPLLVETGLDREFDRVIVVDAPAETQARRLMRRNNLGNQDAMARINAQASRRQRLSVADWVVDNSSDQASTVQQIDRIWADLTAVS
ncbi:dephospho-CoA kinase [Tessaracoccus flavus]|uniref:Dephospho-CoA kinase n=1 Tax=Tessaracoccus flavus TaxID=1610493 RepID=A0A1Q2CDA9_9ACTN|nr:dephospho-CoA kinase [Tessaracoccus flavus]AQP44099.1 dephospho-CoA kinase [Tessaracoccus flavus]